MDQWFNKKFCDRCHKSLADGFSMSRFNTQALCFDCLQKVPPGFGWDFNP